MRLVVNPDPLNLAWTWPTQWTADYALHVATLVPLLVAMTVAAVIDWRTRRIPNWVTFPLLAAGLLRAVCTWLLDIGTFTPVDGVLGVLTGFALSVPLFTIGARGAGDAKLYIAAGAWIGWWGILALFVLEAIVGLVYVVGRAVYRGQVLLLMANTGVLVLTLLNLRQVGLAQARDHAGRFTVYGPVAPDAPRPRFASIDRPLPHAVPILVAAVLAVFLGLL